MHIILFQLGNSAAEEIVDNLQLTDPRLEGGVGSQQTFVRLRRLSLSVVQGGYRTGRWVIEVESGKRVRSMEAMVRERDTIEEMLGRNIGRMMERGGFSSRDRRVGTVGSAR